MTVRTTPLQDQCPECGGAGTQYVHAGGCLRDHGGLFDGLDDCPGHYEPCPDCHRPLTTADLEAAGFTLNGRDDSWWYRGEVTAMTFPEDDSATWLWRVDRERVPERMTPRTPAELRRFLAAVREG